MSLDFWDGIIISSAFWMFVSLFFMVRGLWFGENESMRGWSEGFESGWDACSRVLSGKTETETGVSLGKQIETEG